MKSSEILILGWREWVELPALGLPPIKAKVDTGARTSALHAFALTPFVENDVQRIRFSIHPRQRNDDVVTCIADVVDQRTVRDSGGHEEERWVIESALMIGAHRWLIEMTLTSRDDMQFRMLIGRTAIKGRALVNPSSSYLIGKKPRKKRPKPKA